jgi:hypothetical protein
MTNIPLHHKSSPAAGGIGATQPHRQRMGRTAERLHACPSGQSTPALSREADETTAPIPAPMNLEAIT